MLFNKGQPRVEYVAMCGITTNVKAKRIPNDTGTLHDPIQLFGYVRLALIFP